MSFLARLFKKEKLHRDVLDALAVYEGVRDSAEISIEDPETLEKVKEFLNLNGIDVLNGWRNITLKMVLDLFTHSNSSFSCMPRKSWTNLNCTNPFRIIIQYYCCTDPSGQSVDVLPDIFFEVSLHHCM